MSKKDSLYQPGNHIEEVPGVSVDWRWQGINRTGNRRSIPPNYFWTADNVRMEDDAFIGRKGLTKVNSADASDTSCVIGIKTLPSQPSGDRKFWIMLHEGSGSHIWVYDPQFNSQALEVDPERVLATSAGSFIKYKNNIYTTDGDIVTLREIANSFKLAVSAQIIFPTPSVTIGGVSSPGALSQLVVAPTIETNDERLALRRAQEGDSLFDLYFVSETGVDTNELPYRWDGNQSYAIAEASDVGSLDIGHMGYLNEKVFAVVGTSTEGNPCIYERGFDGTWTAFNCPTLPNEEEFVCMGITYYDDKALLHGYEQPDTSGSVYGTVLVWDGSSLTLGTTTTRVGATDGFASGIHDATVFGGNYYYTWSTPTSPGPFAAYVGKYDGSTFDDTFHNITASVATNHAPVGIASNNDTVVITTHNVGTTSTWKVYTTTDFSTLTEITVENVASLDEEMTGFAHKVTYL